MDKEYIIDIVRMDDFGRGIGYIDNKIIFVKNAIKGEKVKVKILSSKKKYSVGETIEIITPSKNRKNPECKYYKDCGSCHIMHLESKYQEEYKGKKVLELFKKYTNEKDFKYNKIIYDNSLFYRNKSRFHVLNNKIGYYKEKSNELIELDKCLISSKKINKILGDFKLLLNNTNSKINDITIRTSFTDDALVIINGNVGKDDLIKYLGSDINIIVNNKIINGNDYIIDELGQMKFKVSYKSFYQVNRVCADKLVSIISSYVKNKNYKNALDLYCGTGTIGCIISKYVDKVLGIEICEDAIKNANYNKKLNNINNITFICDKVENQIDQIKNNIDLIIVDPPRCGLDNNTISNIKKLNPETIIYISCDPTTLVRDIKLLDDKYHVSGLTLVDMFPNTYHVECVCVLKLR